MIRRSTKGFTLIELMIVISIILVLMALVVVVGPTIFAQVRDMQCQNNLKQIYLALGTYQNEFGGKYPDKNGDLFLAMLYFTGNLINKDTFICPEDAIKNKARWDETPGRRTDQKFLYPGESPEMQEGGSIWPDISGWSDATFEPWEISYAGRRNDPTDDNDFYLSGPPREPTPIVSDDTEKENGEIDRAPIHGKHLNVLLTDGSVRQMAMVVGEKSSNPDIAMDLEALAN
jgi:prepilin-type N-terminal cleavage/methylation domain-containing protein